MFSPSEFSPTYRTHIRFRTRIVGHGCPSIDLLVVVTYGTLMVCFSRRLDLCRRAGKSGARALYMRTEGSPPDPSWLGSSDLGSGREGNHSISHLKSNPWAMNKTQDRKTFAA